MNKYLWAFFLFLSFSCKKELKPTLNLEELQGKWVLTEAFRNDKPTQTLTGAYYQFRDSMLTTNIFGDDFSATFRIENMEIVQHVPMELRYSITKNPDQTLGFSTNISGLAFRFTLKKE